MATLHVRSDRSGLFLLLSGLVQFLVGTLHLFLGTMKKPIV